MAGSSGTSLVNRFLPRQRLTLGLPKERYHLRLSETGGTIGTPCPVELLLSAPK